MKNIWLTLMIAGSLGLTACGSSFNTSTGSSNNGSFNDGDNNGGGGSTPTPTWEKVELNGYADGGAEKGALVVYIDKVNQSLLLVLPIPVIIPIISPMPIADLDGGKLTSYTNQDGSQSLAVSIPLRKIVRGGSFMPHERLPNGDPLPYVPAGELPGFAIEFPQMRNYQIHLYVGVNVAAVFAELPDVGLPFGWISPVKNSAKTKVIGAVGYVAPKGNFDGGMYLAAQLPAELAQAIDDLIRW